MPTPNVREPRLRASLTECVYDAETHTATFTVALADKPYNNGKPEAKRNMYACTFGALAINGDVAPVTVRIDSSIPIVR